jgi:hypothetical protein
VLFHLPEDRREKLDEWLKSRDSFKTICHRIMEQWNINTSSRALSKYYEKFVAADILERRNKTVGVAGLVNKGIRKRPADLASVILDKLALITFWALNSEDTHPRVVNEWLNTFNKLRTNEENLALRKKDLAVKEREIALKEKQFAAAKKTVQDSKLSAEQKVTNFYQLLGISINETPSQTIAREALEEQHRARILEARLKDTTMKRERLPLAKVLNGYTETQAKSKTCHNGDNAGIGFTS